MLLSFALQAPCSGYQCCRGIFGQYRLAWPNNGKINIFAAHFQRLALLFDQREVRILQRAFFWKILAEMGASRFSRVSAA